MSEASDRLREAGRKMRTNADVGLAGIAAFRASIEAAARAQSDAMHASLWAARIGFNLDQLAGMTLSDLAAWVDMAMARRPVEIPATVMRTLAAMRRRQDADTDRIEPVEALREEDLKIEYFHVKTDPVNHGPRGVSITHVPTGILAEAWNGKTQLENKATALTALRLALLDLEGDE